ncbi:hypothetical protein FRC12_000876 [Ceratobasidium sp. 428]|nr:hypothetical protein FRC12_000876 [Ceratobasidium sp. 428]
MSNENMHIDLGAMNMEGDTQSSTPNHGPAVVNQDLAQGVAANIPVADNVQNPVFAPAQIVIQGPNQAILDPAQPVPPVAVAVAVVVDIPNAALPHPPEPPVQAPEPAPIPLIFPLVANGDPADGPLMRTLYGFPNILIEAADGEGVGAQDGNDEA